VPRTAPSPILLHETVTGEDVRRLVEALRENTRVREDELRELRAENALRRYTLEELAELTKVPLARLRRIVATFPHVAVIGGK
jgi:propanediol dehydratase small subunit